MRAAVLLQSLPKHILHDFPVLEGGWIFDRRERSAVNLAERFCPRTEAVFDQIAADDFNFSGSVSDVVHAGFQVSRKLVFGVVLMSYRECNTVLNHTQG